MSTTELLNYVLMFFMTACLGWCMEVTCKLIQFHRFINRGFLIGPYCPIYGFGAVLVTICLERYQADPFAVFGLAMLLCGTLEYMTSYIMEKLFHARWWDYSNKPFNLNGRVCASTLIPFGLLGLFLVYVLKPFLFSLYAQWSLTVLTAVDAVLCTGFTADTVISSIVLIHLRAHSAQAEGDSTEAITKAVRETLAREGILARRLLDAFPHARITNRRLMEKLKQERAQLRREAKEAELRLHAEMEERNRRVKEELRQKKAELKEHAENHRPMKK